MRFWSFRWLFLLLLAGGRVPGAAAQCRLQFDYSQWEETARDDFNGTAIDTTLWDDHVPYGGKYFGWGTEWYDPSDRTLRTVSGGAVHLKATRWVDAQGTPLNDFHDPEKPARTVLYRSSLLLARRGGPFHQPGYGAWEARIKLPNNWMAWQAFWLWSPATEIDLIDGINFDNRGAHPGLLNNVINPTTSCERRFKLWAEQPITQLLTEDYHVYTVVWTPEQVTFFLDGRELRTVPYSVVPTDGRPTPDLMVTMQAQSWVKYFYEFTTDVDYIRVLKPRCQPDAAGTTCQRNYHVAASSYKSASEFVNHDLSAAASPARPDSSARVSAAPGSIILLPDNPNQLFYLGADQQLHLATRQPGGWRTEPLPTRPGWEVLGDATYHAGLRWLVYKGRDQRLHAYYQPPGAPATAGWQHAWVTGATAPLASRQAGAIAQGASELAIVYLGDDQLLHRCPVGSGEQPGSQGVRSPVSTLRNPDGADAAVAGNLLLGADGQTIYYRGADARLQYYQPAEAGPTYAHGWVAGSRRAAPYQVLGQEQAVVRQGSALYYIGQADHRVHCLAYQAETEVFGHSLLPVPHEAAAPGRAEAALAQGSLALNPAGNRLTYVGYDGRLQGYYRNGPAAPWQHYWLDDYWNTGEYEVRPPCAASLATADGLVAYYCGRDQHLRYFAWEACENAETPATCGQR